MPSYYVPDGFYSLRQAIGVLGLTHTKVMTAAALRVLRAESRPGYPMLLTKESVDRYRETLAAPAEEKPAPAARKRTRV